MLHPATTIVERAERGRVLVVDDNAGLLDMHLGALREAGFAAAGVPDAEACFAALCVELPELILLDIHLPDCDGRELCRRLKDDPTTAGVAIMYLSGDEPPDALEGGADGYIARPVSDHELIARVDATLRVKRTEQELRSVRAELHAAVESRERFLNLIRATNHAVWDWDLATDEVRWGEGFEEVFGYAVGAIDPHARFWYDHIHPEERERVYAGIKELIRSGQGVWTDEYRFQCADGRYAYVHDRGFVMHDALGRPARMVGGMIDLSERHQQEEKWRETEERFRQFAENVEDVFWIRELATSRYVYVNPAFDIVWGFARERLDFAFQHHGRGTGDAAVFADAPEVDRDQ